MNSSVFISLALLPLLFSASSASIESTCKAAAVSSPNVNYDFCVATLQSDPRSRSASPSGLAAIATGISANAAASTKTKIDGLLKSSSDKKTKECLETCQEVYSDMTENLRESLQAVKSARYKDAVSYLSAARTQPETCEEEFEEQRVSSSLKKENNNMKALASVALAITAALQ